MTMYVFLLRIWAILTAVTVAAADSYGLEHPTQAPGESPAAIERVDDVRASLLSWDKKMPARKKSQIEQAQYPGWPNWRNWSNWPNWPNWGNYWRNY